MLHATKTSLVLTMIAVILNGCATSPANTNLLKVQVEKTKKETQRLITAREAPVTNNAIAYSDQSWIPLRKIVKNEQEIAKAKTDAIQIEINQRFTSLNDVAGAISSLTGMTVFIGTDTQAPTTSGASGAAGASSASSAASAMPSPMGMAVPSITGANIGMGVTATPIGAITTSSPFTANYAGTLTGFMNLVTSYYGVSWKTETMGIRIYLLDSKTFRIAALPGDTRLTTSVESASNAGNGGSNSTQNGSSSNSTGVGFTGLSVWTAMEAAIKQMLGATGKVIASPAMGTITVTDTPSTLSRVTEYINEQNKSLNRQVSVNVRVLTVEINDQDNYGINWDSVYSTLASGETPFTIGLKTAFPIATGAGSMVISAPASSTSRWAGSSAIISALSTQGRVSELTSATLITLNNQAAPVNVGRRVSYLASSSSPASTVAGASPTVTLTPGTIQTGFSMTLVPHIIDGKEMLLQYSLDLSSLLQMQSITSGSSTIQTPDVSTSNFIQRVRMQSGETLVVAGFDHDNLSAVSSGIGSAENVAMGNRNGKTTRTMLVVLIQPNVSL